MDSIAAAADFPFKKTDAPTVKSFNVHWFQLSFFCCLQKMPSNEKQQVWELLVRTAPYVPYLQVSLGNPPNLPTSLLSHSFVLLFSCLFLKTSLPPSFFLSLTTTYISISFLSEWSVKFTPFKFTFSECPNSGQAPLPPFLEVMRINPFVAPRTCLRSGTRGNVPNAAPHLFG